MKLLDLLISAIMPKKKDQAHRRHWPHGRKRANHSKYSPRRDTPKSQRKEEAP